jgi:hypothetical protein
VGLHGVPRGPIRASDSNGSGLAVASVAFSASFNSWVPTVRVQFPRSRFIDHMNHICSSDHAGSSSLSCILCSPPSPRPSAIESIRNHIAELCITDESLRQIYHTLRTGQCKA